jgi:hypothetical protein
MSYWRNYYKDRCEMSELGDKRKLGTRCLVQLLEKMLDDGYDPMLGKDGLKHMKGSLHFEGLAWDIDLTRDGVYLSSGVEHGPYGEFWEGLHPDCCWGGRFSDANHYSITYMGKK